MSRPVSDEETLVQRFERLAIPAETFRHRDHLHVAFEMLVERDFLEACTSYASTIRSMAEAAGAAEKFNLTITLAFMSLVSERMRTGAPTESFEGFLGTNPDLLTPGVLDAWYSPERLGTQEARRSFLMPDRVSGGTAPNSVS